ncbi:hypothetical protein BJY04DRAFT_231820 [Aspergillus karnatakaensis]|uniref:uncharacterized protein n=1 Tax=Aspergillus karnatakaensis TaxID=1810916 RepID=UPI003CCD90AB
MKVAKSCSQCRSAKRKCTTGVLPLSSCTQCAQKGLRCSLLVNPDSNRPKFLAPAVTTPRLPAHVSDEVRDELIDLYMRLIHDKPHTFFHPATLRTRVQSGSLPETVLFSILAVAARFSNDRSIRERTKDFFHLAKESFKRNLDEVTLDNVHAAALIGNICGLMVIRTGSRCFFGISFRMAQILHLPEPKPEDDAIVRETKIRTYWSLYMIDQWSSAGLDMPRQIPDTSQHPLPMSELSYWQLDLGARERGPSAQDSLGMWGYMVILARVFGKIHELHRQLANGHLADHESEDHTHVLALELEDFIRNLPHNVKFTRENLEQHATQGLGATFVALHLGYHHYSTLLYFHYLDSTLTRVPNQTLFAARCKYHAAAFSDLLSSSNEVSGCEALYFIVGHMTVISSSALLHTLLFGEPDEIPDARRRLSSNFQVLLKLKQYWPDVNTMITRLFTFQEACMRSTDRVYVVDKWIVKFLLQHALPIDHNRRPPPTENLAERDRFAEDALSILR